MFILNIFSDGCQKRSGEIAILEKIIAFFKVDRGDGGSNGGGFGFLREFGKGVFGLGEVIIRDIRGGGTENARDFGAIGDETGEA